MEFLKMKEKITPRKDNEEYYVFCYECNEVKFVSDLIWDGIHFRCKEHPYGIHREITIREIVKQVIKINDEERTIEAITNGL